MVPRVYEFLRVHVWSIPWSLFLSGVLRVTLVMSSKKKVLVYFLCTYLVMAFSFAQQIIYTLAYIYFRNNMYFYIRHYYVDSKTGTL
jgi:hypothetical protein